MEIKNLAQLKRAIQAGSPFVIVKHHLHPDFDGQVRKPSVVQTNGFYSVILGDPDHRISKANDGKGFWLAYGKAGDWAFEDGLCKLVDRRKNSAGEILQRPVWEIKFIEEALAP